MHVLTCVYVSLSVCTCVCVCVGLRTALSVVLQELSSLASKPQGSFHLYPGMGFQMQATRHGFVAGRLWRTTSGRYACSMGFTNSALPRAMHRVMYDPSCMRALKLLYCLSSLDMFLFCNTATIVLLI